MKTARLSSNTVSFSASCETLEPELSLRDLYQKYQRQSEAAEVPEAIEVAVNANPLESPSDLKPL